MKIADIVPKNGEPQRLYCPTCKASMDLVFEDFSDLVSGVAITIKGLPQLCCPQCAKLCLTDGGAFAILELHRQAVEKGALNVHVTRKKRTDQFDFGKIKFLYDPDDYFYIPGLYRSFDVGFLTPLLFNKRVLIKFDNSPDYDVQFASQSYGTIYTEERYISFGINRHGKVIMWLGDVATLPESEQYYLRSENVESDHSIGSEFYDAQIEAQFTDLTAEATAIKARSRFAQAFEARFGCKAFHLDAELIDTIAGLTPPLVDTEKERKHVFDSLNRIFVEAIDNAGMNKLLKSLKAVSAGSGSLKRMQAVLETAVNDGSIASALSPLYVSNDLRIAYSHLTSANHRAELLATSATRLSVPADASLDKLYAKLVLELAAALNLLADKIATGA